MTTSELLEHANVARSPNIIFVFIITSEQFRTQVKSDCYGCLMYSHRVLRSLQSASRLISFDIKAAFKNEQGK